MSTRTATVTVPVNEHDDVHDLFDLSYSNYLVLPRTLLQSMPEPWQYAFTALVRRYEQAFTFQPQAESYQVTAGTEREVGCLDEAELKAAGIEKVWDEAAECHRLYRISDAVEIDEDSSVFLPGIDPVPYYKRGHGRVGPDPTAAADLAVANSARG